MPYPAKKPAVPKFEKRIIHIGLYQDTASTAACYLIESLYDVKNMDYLYQMGVRRKCADLGQLAKEITRRVLENNVDADLVLVNHKEAKQVNARRVAQMPEEVELNALRTCKNYLERVIKDK